MRNSCEGVHEIQAVGFFMAGCRPNTMLWHKLRRSEPKTMAALMAIADKYALAEEASSTPAEILPAPSRRDNNKPAEHKPAEGGHHGSRRDNYCGKRHSDQPDRRYGSAHVAAVSDHAAAGGSRRQKQTDRPWKPKYTFEQMLDSPCKYHSGKNPSNHTTRDCHFMKRLTSGEPLPPPPPPPPAGGPGGQAGAEANNLEHHEANQVHHGGRYLAEDATYIIFTTEPEDRTSQQRRSLEVNAVMPPVPQYLNWSEQAITFDRRDTPAVLPKPGSVRFSRVLIDGGSSINILYRDTARKLGIQEAELRPTPTVFHGIVPGHSCQPIGRITLAVMFGKPDHFRTENVEFEVVDLVSPYHALLGRPALTKFMAVPHYGYLKMKLSGPKGVITVAGDYRRSMECATQSSKMAQTLVIAAEKQLISDAVAMAKAVQSGMPGVGNPAGTRPEDWLQDYSTAFGIAKGNKRWAVRYSPLMLLGSARTWLNNLPAGSINGWLDFEEAFISNFTGTYRRPGRPQQLEMCKQGPDETDRAYLTRWCEMRNSCEGVHEIQAVGFFMAGCRPNTMLWHKLRRSEPKTMAARWPSHKYALAEEASSTPAEISPAPSRRDNNKPAEHKPAEGGHHGSRRDNYRGKRHSDQPDRRYGSAHVAAVSDHAAAGGSRRQKQTDRPWKPKYTFEQMLDSPCKYHSGKNPSNHTTRDCHFMKRLTSGEPLPPPPPPPPAGGPGGQAGAEANNLEHHEANQVHHGGRYLAEDATYIIFTTEPEDRTSQQRRSLEVNAVMPPVPQYLNWSEQAITFDRRDTPAVLPKPGSVRFSRVLIDGGSSINILYRDTAHKLGIQEAELRPTPTVFHGIVPGHSCQPIGRITLAVMFGKPDHFRTENVEFEVVDLVSPYHALLGRPALTKFMAVPHYGYLKMKLPGPKGVITVAGDYRRSMECATQSSKMAQTLVIAAEKQLISDAVAMAKAAQSGMPAVGNPAGTTHFQPANDTKKILLDPAQPDKFVTIGAGLSSK
ncbi:hypothetical protein QYE76_054151 [Lolium multiflorum]|uniref:Retrotransposon gag domain-containing protein n=1 Tax=Lolium multiflorum TaxID=4521 RepID=A0AAD8WKI7_LOLMU|nr:hypothetical protein QYE76_054151 [Lolium multiflorum]